MKLVTDEDICAKCANLTTDEPRPFKRLSCFTASCREGWPVTFVCPWANAIAECSGFTAANERTAQ